MRTILELDAGPVINQYQCSISEDDTTHSMERKLASLGAEKIADLLSHNDPINFLVVLVGKLLGE